MSGGGGGPDPYYCPTKQDSKLGSSGVAQPKRVEMDDSGKPLYVYDCAGCGKEFRTPRPKKYRTTHCDEKCRRKALGRLGASRRGIPRTPAEKEAMSEGQRKAWQVPETRRAHIEGIERYNQQREPRPKKKAELKQPKYAYICPVCGDIFWTKHKSQKFCSQRCNAARKKRGTQEKCANPDCNNHFYKRASRPDRKYCSKLCADRDPARLERMSKAQEPNKRNWKWNGWENERTDKLIWIPLAAKIREADHHTCQSCGRVHQHGENAFPVHHIIPWSMEGPDEEWNLITLCPECHRKTDVQGGPVRFPNPYLEKLE